MPSASNSVKSRYSEASAWVKAVPPLDAMVSRSCSMLLAHPVSTATKPNVTADRTHFAMSLGLFIHCPLSSLATRHMLNFDADQLCPAILSWIKPHEPLTTL